MKQNTKRIPAKGTSRRVVIVPCDHDSVFEQVIYIVRDEWASKRGITADHILREAEELIRLDSENDDENIPRSWFPHPLLLLLLLILFLFLAVLIYLRFS